MTTASRKELAGSLASALLEVESALTQSYCPCSGLCVAAGLVLDDGRTVTGVNYESASYGLTLCAERAALARAQAEGSIDQAVALILSAKWQHREQAGRPLTPCGACRQWLSELAARLGRDLPVYSFWCGADSGIKTSAGALLPGSFGLEDLSTDPRHP